MQNILIYTDGASLGNPGSGGYGAVILFLDQKVIEIGGKEENTTNNRMELMAILKSLEFVESRKVNDSIEIFSDSAYAVNGLNGWMYSWEKNNWKTKEGNLVLNRDIWEKLLGIFFRLSNTGIKISKVSGHSGILLNERVDILASCFAQGQKVALFSGNFSQYEKIIKDLKFRQQKKVSKEPAYSYVSLVEGVLKTHKDWNSCKNEVEGKSGAKYKKVFSKDEEKELLRKWAQI